MKLSNFIEQEYSSHKHQMIEKALCQSDSTMLPIKEFVRITEAELPNLLPFGLVWKSFNEDVPIYLSNSLIELFGYKGEIKSQKMALFKLIKKYNVNVTVFDNLEYEKFLESNQTIRDMYPSITKAQLKSRPKHILITTSDLKMLLSVNTANGEAIRKYYIAIEFLFYAYLQYQCEFYKRLFENELHEIHDMPQNKAGTRKAKIQALDRMISEKYRVGVIYYICEKDNDQIVKIGYTFNLPERLTALQCAHYKELIVKKYYLTQYPHIEETRLHNLLYKSDHVRGEWFKL